MRMTVRAGLHRGVDGLEVVLIGARDAHPGNLAHLQGMGRVAHEHLPIHVGRVELRAPGERGGIDTGIEDDG